MTSNNALWKPHPGPQTYVLSVSDVYETLYGGSRGGGKTDAGIVWLLKHTDNPDFRGLVIRRNSIDLTDWIDRAQRMYPTASITGQPPTITFPSGAKIRTGHLQNENAFQRYQGHEYQRIVIEELTQIPDEQQYLKLISSCRSTVEGIAPQVFCTTNPGNQGHAWVKARWRIGDKASNKAFKDPISGRYRMYVPATIDDNPTLVKNDPDYVAFLESLPEPLRSAWRSGDWDVYAGQFFTEFTEKKHVITESRAKELGYGSHINHRYMGIDWGYAAPFCCLWIEVTRDNKVFVYRELYGNEKHPGEWGEEISKINQQDDIVMALGDPSMWIRNPMSWNNPATTMYSDKSIALALMDAGVSNLQPANNSRVNGWRNMAQLMHFDEGIEPNFYIIKGSCPNLVRTIPLMIRDEKNPEDLDTTTEDHAVDACRYALTSVVAPTKSKKDKPVLQQQIDNLMMPEEESWNYDFNK